MKEKWWRFRSQQIYKYSEQIGFGEINIEIPSDFFLDRNIIWWTKNKQESVEILNNNFNEYIELCEIKSFKLFCNVIQN